MNIISKIDQQTAAAKAGLPAFQAGDLLKVSVRITEGDRSRAQVFEGICISRHSAGAGSSFTVRKLSFGEGVERVFPLYSPVVEKIEVVRRGDVRRAKLYYLRGRTGKAARIAEKSSKNQMVGSDIAANEAASAADLPAEVLAAEVTPAPAAEAPATA
jgi:large subunit ribosomal protein L19